MAYFELVSKSIEAGWGDDGFFAFGKTSKHCFVGDDVPDIEDMAVTWSIRTKRNIDTLNFVVNHRLKEHTSQRTPYIRQYFEENKRGAKGMLHRWDISEPINLEFWLPNDPALPSLIMGTIATDRELSIFSNGWLFLEGDALAPAPSVIGFLERSEPAFTPDLPLLRIK